jgi:hypothetical protein
VLNVLCTGIVVASADVGGILGQPMFSFLQHHFLLASDHSSHEKQLYFKHLGLLLKEQNLMVQPILPSMVTEHVLQPSYQVTHPSGIFSLQPKFLFLQHQSVFDSDHASLVKQL